MKRIIILTAVCALLLCSCTSPGESAEYLAIRTAGQSGKPASKSYRIAYIVEEAQPERGEPETERLKGIWISQFDMSPVYRRGARQRDIGDYAEKVDIMLDNLAGDGFNTVFLQLRPNGDSMYESAVYPTSKYIAGVYGGNIEYDAIGIFVEKAKEHGLSIHAWINPFRLCGETELLAYTGDSILAQWAKEIGTRIKRGADGILYLDPSYEEATALITDGVREILEKYDFDGIHIDDYFYPTEFELDDSAEFAASGYSNLGEFRRSSINRTVKAIYDTVHKFKGKIFGIAPAGNIYSLENGWYADIYTWCGTPGYADYIMPQLYYGFRNSCCPFETILADWSEAVTESGVALYIGLSAAKCVLGSEGKPDSYAGSEGIYEWRDEKDIIARSISLINDSEKAKGFCIFTYSSLYDPLTGEANPLISEEREAFAPLIAG